MRSMTRRFFFAIPLAAATLGFGSTAMADSASVRIQIYKAGFVVGVSGGRGVMHFHGKNYALSVGGVSLGATIGASKADLVGRVSNIHDPSDVEGVYSGGGAGVAVAGGRKSVKLTNSKGAVLVINGRQMGLMFSIDLDGMQISLKQ